MGVSRHNFSGTHKAGTDSPFHKWNKTKLSFLLTFAQLYSQCLPQTYATSTMTYSFSNNKLSICIRKPKIEMWITIPFHWQSYRPCKFTFHLFKWVQSHFDTDLCVCVLFYSKVTKIKIIHKHNDQLLKIHTDAKKQYFSWIKTATCKYKCKN